MWTIIIFTVIAILIACLIESKDKYRDFEMYFLVSILGLVIGLVVGLLIALLLPVKTEIVKTTYNLELLQDNNSVQGSFFLGCGQIEGKMKYVFYYEEKGYYRLEQIDYSEAMIKYSEEKPRVEYYTEEKVKDNFMNNFTIYWNCSCKDYYIIYIPKGTIKNNYTLDGK